MDPATVEAKLYERALRLLGAREHSREELRAKLLARGGADAEIVDALLERLAAAGIQSDERFAEAWVRSRIARGHGPLRIRNDLLARGIEAELVDVALEAADCDWREQLASVHRRKFGDTRPVDSRDLARRARFLAYRGFASGEVYRLLRDD